MSKHTPGPWETNRFHAILGGTEIQYVNGSGRPQVALACVVEEGSQEANARLISAAPELLEALRGVLRVADRATDEFDAARAAIAKATAEETPAVHQSYTERVPCAHCGELSARHPNSKCAVFVLGAAQNRRAEHGT